MGWFKILVHCLFASLLWPCLTFSSHAFWWGNESTLTEINQAVKEGPFSYTCGETVYESETCPYVFKQLEEDKKSGILARYFNAQAGKSPWAQCQEYVRETDSLTAQELEERLAANPETEIGLRDDYFSSQMQRCHQPSIYDENQQDMNDHERSTIVANSYRYLNRIHLQTKQIVQDMAQLNTLMGDNVLNDIPCTEFSMPKDSALCQQLRQNDCRPQQDGIEVLNEQLGKGVGALLAIKAKISETQDPESKERFETIYESILSQYPVLNSDEIKNHLESNVFTEDNLESLTDDEKSNVEKEEFVNEIISNSQSSLKSHLRDQLENNREAYKNKLQNQIELNRCLVYGNESDCEDFDERMQRINHGPDRGLTYDQETYAELLENAEDPDLESDRAMAEGSYYGNAACYNNYRDIKQGVNELTVDTGVQAGLTILSGGTLGVAGGIIRAGAAAGRAARGASLLANSSFLGSEVQEAIENCDQSLSQLEGSTQVTKNETLQCPEGTNGPRYNVAADTNSCVTGVLLTSVDALPFTPRIAKRLNTRATRQTSTNSRAGAGRRQETTTNSPSSTRAQVARNVGIGTIATLSLTSDTPQEETEEESPDQEQGETQQEEQSEERSEEQQTESETETASEDSQEEEDQQEEATQDSTEELPPFPPRVSGTNFSIPGGKPLVPPQPPMQRPPKVFLLKGFP